MEESRVVGKREAGWVSRREGRIERKKGDRDEEREGRLRRRERIKNKEEEEGAEGRTT